MVWYLSHRVGFSAGVIGPDLRRDRLMVKLIFVYCRAEDSFDSCLSDGRIVQHVIFRFAVSWVLRLR